MARAPLLALAAALAAAPGARAGEAATECLADFRFQGAPAQRIRCVDGDPACDADPTPGVCRFDVSVCFNTTDPKLRCTARELEHYDVENVEPDTDGRHDFEFGALQTAVDTLGFPIAANETELCAGPVAMLLPLAVRVQRSGADYGSFKKTLRADTFGPGDPLDRDALPMKCLPAKGADPCDGIDSTFAEIERHVFTGCTRDTCHNAPGGGHTLTLLPGEAYADLIGAMPDSTIAAAAGKLRVAPGEPDRSFLLYKLRGELLAGEGARMPRDLPKLSAKKVRLVEAWIEAGAPATGFVADVGCRP
jgi:hypothetical protein